MRRSMGWLMAALGASVAAPSLAQLAPPPTSKEKDRVTTPTPTDAPAPAPRPAPPPPKPQLTVPDIAVAGVGGEIIRVDLEQNIDIVAFAANQLFSNAHWERCLPDVMEWMADVEATTIDNLDLVLEIENGFFETLDIKDRANVAYAAELVKPLTSNAQLSKYLLENGAINRAQFDQNNKIVAKFDQAVFAKVLERPEVKNAGAEERAGWMAKHMFNTSTREVRRAFRRLVQHGSMDFDKATAKAKTPVASLPSEQVSVLRDSKAAPEAKAEAFRAIIKSMDFFKAQDLLRAVAELHPVTEPAWAPKTDAPSSTPDDAGR